MSAPVVSKFERHKAAAELVASDGWKLVLLPMLEAEIASRADVLLNQAKTPEDVLKAREVRNTLLQKIETIRSLARETIKPSDE